MKRCLTLLLDLTIILIFGCATVNSDSRDDRILAVSRMQGDNEKLIQALQETSYDDVRIEVVKLLGDYMALAAIAFDNSYSIFVREQAARRLKDEEDVIRVVQDTTFSIELRNELTSNIFSEKNNKVIVDCLDINLDSRIRAMKNINDAFYLRGKVYDKTAEKVLRMCAIAQISDINLLKEIANSRLAYEFRKCAIEKMCKNVNALKELIRMGVRGKLLSVIVPFYDRLTLSF